MATRAYDVRVEGLGEMLRDLRWLPKEAQKDLRAASKDIARNHMVPAWKEAAIEGAGPWGEAIASSVRAGSDRVPKVMIGRNTKKVSGGATPTMLRYPSDKGDRGRAAKGARNRMPAAFGSGTDWISQSRAYTPKAMQEWSDAIRYTINKWRLR